MLGDKTAAATVAVKDMEAAKKFYEEKLGLAKADYDDEGGVMYKTGDSTLFVYESQFAGSNKATAVTWTVGDDLDKLIEELKGKGVKFEHYDMPEVKHEGDVHVFGELRAAWFKDPDGNIHSLIN